MAERFLSVGITSSALVDVPAPDAYTWGLQDVSAPDAGRAQNSMATMNKMLITQKRKIQLTWQNREDSEISTILQAFNHEYVWVRYKDAMSNSYETREFYVGDRSSVLKRLGIHSSLTLNVIER